MLSSLPDLMTNMITEGARGSVLASIRKISVCSSLGSKEILISSVEAAAAGLLMNATSGNMVTTVSKGSSSNCPSEYNQRHAVRIGGW
ncbi:hypothetical protein AALO_G00253970 [Alosa alosa]|uniref:Uncharacterized protein n=1 Tax=Alosa alosa TaxID=278164 RepID=A0AAV6FSH1_9TELE|nr:hypothetical protein AALO_G00253970 [Alosa alosa]